MSFLTLFSVTFEKFNVLQEWKLANLILCTLLWFLNVSSIFTSSSRLLILFVLRFMYLVIFIKYLFIIVAFFPSSLTISFPSTSKMLFEFKRQMRFCNRYLRVCFFPLNSALKIRSQSYVQMKALYPNNFVVIWSNNSHWAWSYSNLFTVSRLVSKFLVIILFIFLLVIIF